MYKTVTRGDRIAGRVKLFIDLMKLDNYLKRHGVSRMMIPAPRLRGMVEYYTLVSANNRLKAAQGRLELWMYIGTDDGVLDMMDRHMEVLCARRCVLNELIVLIATASLDRLDYEAVLTEYRTENDEVADLILRRE